MKVVCVHKCVHSLIRSFVRSLVISNIDLSAFNSIYSLSVTMLVERLYSREFLYILISLIEISFTLPLYSFDFSFKHCRFLSLSLSGCVCVLAKRLIISIRYFMCFSDSLLFQIVFNFRFHLNFSFFHFPFYSHFRYLFFTIFILFQLI